MAVARVAEADVLVAGDTDLTGLDLRGLRVSPRRELLDAVAAGGGGRPI
jgi:predicted nucleic acid-binding protein